MWVGVKIVRPPKSPPSPGLCSAASPASLVAGDGGCSCPGSWCRLSFSISARSRASRYLLAHGPPPAVTSLRRGRLGRWSPKSPGPEGFTVGGGRFKSSPGPLLDRAPPCPKRAVVWPAPFPIPISFFPAELGPDQCPLTLSQPNDIPFLAALRSRPSPAAEDGQVESRERVP